MQQNIAMIIEYDGSGFYGFQKQIAVRTVQQTLEKALSLFAGHEIIITNAGRTDTGVHATHQVINFFTTVVREDYKWMRGVNSLLPNDIVIKKVVIVNTEFNARYSAISRTYTYYLLNSSVKSAILDKKVGWYHNKLDIIEMKEAAKLLLGSKDFSSFRASSCQANTPMRHIREIEVINCSFMGIYEDMICMVVTANAFLHHMVRNIIGALVYVGNNKLSVAEFEQLIIAKDRTSAPPTFMADGLYLTHVEYPLEFGL